MRNPREAPLNRSGPPDEFDVATFHARAGYDARLEAEAMERLAALDVDGCRVALYRLAMRLTPPGPGDESAVSQLLLDVLHRVNRLVHPAPESQRDYQEWRLRLIRRFNGCSYVERARELFRDESNRLLARLNGRPGPSLVVCAKRYIEAHYHRRISLSSIAAELNVSSSHLARQFRREEGATLTTYVHRIRLGHARAMLLEGGRTISEIAYRVGYQTYRDFYRNFVKHERASPRSARRRLLDHGAASDGPGA